MALHGGEKKDGGHTDWDRTPPPPPPRNDRSRPKLQENERKGRRRRRVTGQEGCGMAVVTVNSRQWCGLQVRRGTGTRSQQCSMRRRSSRRPDRPLAFLVQSAARHGIRFNGTREHRLATGLPHAGHAPSPSSPSSPSPPLATATPLAPAGLRRDASWSPAGGARRRWTKPRPRPSPFPSRPSPLRSRSRN